MFLQPGSVSENYGERRSLQRFSMKLPASVKVSGIPCEFPTETENVSGCGIFFYLDRWMTTGARVEITMSFPAEVTMAEPVRVRLIARVVRVESEEWAKRVGMAAAIEEYEYVPFSEGLAYSADLPGFSAIG